MSGALIEGESREARRSALVQDLEARALADAKANTKKRQGLSGIRARVVMISQEKMRNQLSSPASRRLEAC